MEQKNAKTQIRENRLQLQARQGLLQMTDSDLETAGFPKKKKKKQDVPSATRYRVVAVATEE